LKFSITLFYTKSTIKNNKDKKIIDFYKTILLLNIITKLQETIPLCLIF